MTIFIGKENSAPAHPSLRRKTNNSRITMNSQPPTPNNSDILLYQTEGGHTPIEVKFKGETALFSLNQMAGLFQRDKSVN